MKIIGVIPARWKSSRFPGKPLADICGKPMIWHVYSQCMKVDDFDSVYVATDDAKIFEACESLGVNVVMTSDSCMTGMDRVGEVARKISADLFVNIQGDEPLIEPETIKKAITPFYDDEALQVTNLMTRIKNPVDAVNPTIPKVITSREGIGIFLTRSAAPYPKGRIDYAYYKQVCVYGVRPSALEFFCDYGKRFGKAEVESVEDIEILRFIENGYRVKYVEVDSDSIAVDTPKDLEKVIAIFAENELRNSRGGGYKQ